MPTFRRGSAFIAAFIAFLAIATSPAAHAEGKSKSLDPVHEAKKAAFFKVKGVDADTIKRATFRARSGERRIRRDVGLNQVRSAAASGRTLRVGKPAPAKRGRLEVVLVEPPVVEPPIDEPDVEEPPAEEPGCVASLVGQSLRDCSLLFDDVGATGDVNGLWGTIGCQADSRHQRVSSGGDVAPTALGKTQDNSSFRRLTVQDGDDYYGERCEIGRNEHRYGDDGGAGTAMLYREGQRRITHMSLRLPDNFPLEATKWQVVMQMKQTQPSANGGGTPVLSLEARAGKWRLMQSTSTGPSSLTRELWSAPAQRNLWTRFAFDVNYSQNPGEGSVKVYADLNGDGDAGDSMEQSSTFETYTLKREIEGGPAGDGIAPGDSIPAHLRIGPYHHPDIACPSGCSVDVDNVQVLRG